MQVYDWDDEINDRETPQETLQRRIDERHAARDLIRARVRCTDYLTRGDNGLYFCPICGSGTHDNRTPAMKYNSDTNTVWCFSCMSKGDKPKDVIDLIQIIYGCGYNNALTIGAEAAGIEPGQQEARRSDFKKTGGQNIHDDTQTPQNAPQPPKKQNHDYRAYYRECMQRIEDPAAVAYLTARGISLETAKRCYLGYDPRSDPTGKRHPAARIIIPTSRGHYFARAIDPAEKYPKMNPTGATPGIFNEWVLDKQPGTVFITEGSFDALSICEAGAQGIATNGATNTERLLQRLDDNPPPADTAFIICEDQDRAGKDWGQAIRDGLQARGFSFLQADLTAGKYKDANEALQGDRQAFIDRVQHIESEAQELCKLWKI